MCASPKNSEQIPDSQHKKKTSDLWALEPHICKKCFGRIVSSDGEGNDRNYRCTHCGAVAYGRDASVLCCCGIMGKPRNRAKSAAPVNMGIRCVVNPHPSPDFPAEIVATELPK